MAAAAYILLVLVLVVITGFTGVTIGWRIGQDDVCHDQLFQRFQTEDGPVKSNIRPRRVWYI